MLLISERNMITLYFWALKDFVSDLIVNKKTLELK